mmetsp:Transcript_8682/g.38626  ORF Transcript_8682/g.38626 Transcript_8682/m.38626 type:complete len:228 (-) Transcript_8682:225-908(-)
MKPMPTLSMHWATPSGERSSGIPMASRTSAEPDLLEIDLFPCLATVAPQAAERTAAIVDIFTVSAPSPPVPTISRTSFRVSTGSILDFIAFAIAATSVAVSFFARRRARKTASSSGLASPSKTSPIADDTSSSDRSSRPASLSRTGFIDHTTQPRELRHLLPHTCNSPLLRRSTVRPWPIKHPSPMLASVLKNLKPAPIPKSQPHLTEPGQVDTTPSKSQLTPHRIE